MSRPNRGAGIKVEDLIETLNQKLLSNRTYLEKSLPYGRLVWRYDQRSQKLVVDLELKL